jgi:hypothetical protein
MSKPAPVVAPDPAAAEYVGWRRRLGQRWAAVAFGASGVQAADDLRAYLRREGGCGRAVVLERGRRPGDLTVFRRSGCQGTAAALSV